MTTPSTSTSTASAPLTSLVTNLIMMALMGPDALAASKGKSKDTVSDDASPSGNSNGTGNTAAVDDVQDMLDDLEDMLTDIAGDMLIEQVRDDSRALAGKAIDKLMEPVVKTAMTIKASSLDDVGLGAVKALVTMCGTAVSNLQQRSAECADLAQMCLNLRDERRQLEAEVDGLEDQTDAQYDKIEELEWQADEMTCRLTAAENVLTDTNLKLGAAENQRDELKRKVDELRQRLDFETAKRVALQKELYELRNGLAKGMTAIAEMAGLKVVNGAPGIAAAGGVEIDIMTRNGGPYTDSIVKVGTLDLTADQARTISVHINGGRKIDAIKALRVINPALGLLEAKVTIENLMDRNWSYT